MKPNRCPWEGRERQDAAPFGHGRGSPRAQAIHQALAGTAARHRLARPATHGHRGRNREPDRPDGSGAGCPLALAAGWIVCWAGYAGPVSGTGRAPRIDEGRANSRYQSTPEMQTPGVLAPGVEERILRQSRNTSPDDHRVCPGEGSRLRNASYPARRRQGIPHIRILFSIRLRPTWGWTAVIRS